MRGRALQTLPLLRALTMSNNFYSMERKSILAGCMAAVRNCPPVTWHTNSEDISAWSSSTDSEPQFECHSRALRSFSFIAIYATQGVLFSRVIPPCATMGKLNLLWYLISLLSGRRPPPDFDKEPFWLSSTLLQNAPVQVAPSI